MADEIERVSQNQDLEPVPTDEIEAEGATTLPDKEVMSLLDVNANVDLGLDLAAPVDLAVAANLNVAAPIEAAASANVLSDGAEATAIAQQQGSIDQGISGVADANATQDAAIAQGGATDAADATATPLEAGATALPVEGTVGGTTDAVGGAVDGATGAVDGATGGVVDG